MFSILLIIHVAACLMIIFFVLLQSGRGAELGAAFGSAGQANSVRSQMTGIGKITTAVAVVFMLTSLSLAYLSSEAAKTSVVNTVQETQVIPGTEAPAPEAASEPAATLELKSEEEKPSELMEQKEAPPLQSQ
ncbi:MAG: preprotein translocase subunit SecG [bacterium]|jgi:preprotein translocase subunit SecG